eukprot:4561246-Pyramimonas_sp.AAC.1
MLMLSRRAFRRLATRALLPTCPGMSIRRHSISWRSISTVDRVPSLSGRGAERSSMNMTILRPPGGCSPLPETFCMREASASK